MSGEIVVGRSKTFSEFFLKVGLVVGKLLFLPPVLFRTGGGLFGYLCKLLAIFAPSKNEWELRHINNIFLFSTWALVANIAKYIRIIEVIILNPPWSIIIIHNMVKSKIMELMDDNVGN